jgi:hypothetical protein
LAWKLQNRMHPPALRAAAPKPGCHGDVGDIRPKPTIKEKNMTLGMLLLIIVILLLVGAIPAWPYSRNWGYAPSGLVGVVLVVVLVLLLAGQI